MLRRRGLAAAALVAAELARRAPGLERRVRTLRASGRRGLATSAFWTVGDRLPHGAWFHALVARIALAVAPSNIRLAQLLVLADFARERVAQDEVGRRHTRPALDRIQAQLAGGTRIARVIELGEQPANPLVSIVVPLYRRLDLLEHQLAQFAGDEDVRSSDVVYVLDSPEQADALETLARDLFGVYGVPLRLVILNRNGGFATANNLGASVARGRLLLLLNSDVLPVEPGWLIRMASFYDATPGIGALGAKLLWEDDTLQHAGMYFDRTRGVKLWTNDHFFKGMHRDFPPANVARRVPAVTGACLMIATELFREVGGLRGGFVQGDFEDSDLCLRLRDAGYETWYDPEAELYHLEGQSYEWRTRVLTYPYNVWLHTTLWRDRLEELERAEDPAALPEL